MSDITLKLLAMYDHRGDGMPTQYVNPDGPEAVEAILALRARVSQIETALVDLMSWFPDKPSDPEWRIKGGEHGADGAVEFARAALATEAE